MAACNEFTNECGNYSKVVSGTTLDGRKWRIFLQEFQFLKRLHSVSIVFTRIYDTAINTFQEKMRQTCFQNMLGVTIL